MLVTRWVLCTSIVLIALGIGAGTFVLFDGYVDRVASELISATLKAEAAAIQQGNVLGSIAKLQSAVQASESLRGVAVYDRGRDPSLSAPVLILGHLPTYARGIDKDEFKRLGVFRRIYRKDLSASLIIFFYFSPEFIFWAYTGTYLSLLFLLACIAWLAGRLATIRADERALVMSQISQQVSHDLRSPLTALKMFGGVMAKRGMDVDIVVAGVARIEGIIDDLQHRSTSGKKPPIDPSFDATKAIDEVVNEKRMEYPAVSLEFTPVDVIDAKGQKSDFLRIISNLINNAVEAGGANSCVDLTCVKVEEQVLITVKDAGPGIPADRLKRLFRRGATFGKHHGQGLGLYHARETLAKMGGSIDLGSQPGNGTTVFIHLIAAPPNHPGAFIQPS